MSIRSRVADALHGLPPLAHRYLQVELVMRRGAGLVRHEHEPELAFLLEHAELVTRFDEFLARERELGDNDAERLKWVAARIAGL